MAPFELEGRVAVVTGGDGVLGGSMAEALGAAGAPGSPGTGFPFDPFIWSPSP